MRSVRFVAAGFVLAALACGNDLEPCEEQVESLDDLAGTWETVELFAASEEDPTSSWYAWIPFHAYYGARVTIGAGGGIQLAGRTWDDSLLTEVDVAGSGTITLDGDSVTIAWSAIDPALIERAEIRLQFPITFRATVRNGWPEHSNWGLFETVECRATSEQWLELRADSTAASVNPELGAAWTPARVEWMLVVPGATLPWR